MRGSQTPGGKRRERKRTALRIDEKTLQWFVLAAAAVIVVILAALLLNY
ncbi:hypothetical protein [Caproiciproducens sp. LBM24188]|nr:hypothetical protein [Clostridiales bacterium]